MTTNNELREGETVRIVKGRYLDRIGEIQLIGEDVSGTPLYLVSITLDLVYKEDEIERVTPEESRGAV